MGETRKGDRLRSKKGQLSLQKENEALRRSLDQHKTLMQWLPLGFLAIQKGEILDANEEILKQLGYAPEEMVNHDLSEFVPGQPKKLQGEIFGKRRAGKAGSDPDEIELIDKEGMPVALDTKVRKIRSHGKSLFLVLLARNEERKKREAHLVQSAKEEALRTMADGLGAALKNPIQSVRLGASLAKKLLEPAGHGREAKKMEEAVLRMESLSNALQCLTKNRGELSKREPFDLRKVVRDALLEAGLRAREGADRRAANVKVKTYLRSVSPVQGDADEIRQVLSHVVVNAVDAMPEGGYLYLSTEENAGYAHIYIQDSGSGIPPQICEKVLDPFFTTKGTEKPGLGLSLCHAIIRRHLGEIEISSRKNQGTMVTLRLPLAKREAQESKKPPRKKGIRHARVLIIEEAPMIGELLLQMFKSKGCTVEIAATATQGLAQVQRKPFDLVIVGAGISEMKGESLARRIKKMKPPVPVALIADGWGADRGESGHPPFVDLVITKPIDMSQTLERITEVLNGAR